MLMHILTYEYLQVSIVLNRAIPYPPPPQQLGRLAGGTMHMYVLANVVKATFSVHIDGARRRLRGGPQGLPSFWPSSSGRKEAV